MFCPRNPRSDANVRSDQWKRLRLCAPDDFRDHQYEDVKYPRKPHSSLGILCKWQERVCRIQSARSKGRSVASRCRSKGGCLDVSSRS